MRWSGRLRRVRGKPQIFCAPGNAGIDGLATCVPIKADDIAGLRDFALKEQIDLTVVGPEAPLALGNCR
jgi:phosphoribosylamine--glycine ligase